MTNDTNLQKYDKRMKRRTLEDVRLFIKQDEMRDVAKAEKRKELISSYDRLMSKSDYKNMLLAVGYRDQYHLFVDNMSDGCFRTDLHMSAMDAMSIGATGEEIKGGLISCLQKELHDYVVHVNGFFLEDAQGIPRWSENSYGNLARPSIVIASLDEMMYTKYGMPSQININYENQNRTPDHGELTPEEWEIKKSELGLNPGRYTLEAEAQKGFGIFRRAREYLARIFS